MTTFRTLFVLSVIFGAGIGIGAMGTIALISAPEQTDRLVKLPSHYGCLGRDWFTNGYRVLVECTDSMLAKDAAR